MFELNSPCKRNRLLLHVVFLAAIVFNYVLPLIVYQIHKQTFLLLAVFIFSYFLIYRRLSILRIQLFLGRRLRVILLYLMVVLSFIFPTNYYLLRLFPLLALCLSERGGYVNKLLALGALYLTLQGYSKVYFALVPLVFYKLVPGNALVKLGVLSFGLVAFGSKLVAKLGQFSIAKLSQGDLLGFDVLWLSEYVITNYPSKFPFLFGKSLFAVVSNPVPRSLWEGKPIAYGIELAMKFWNITDYTDVPTNYGPGIVAEAFANFGFLGIPIFSGVIAFLLRIVEDFSNRTSVSVYFFTPFIFLLIRGDFLNGCINLILQLLVIRFLIIASSGEKVFRRV